MSYALSAALQEAVFLHLEADAGLMALVGYAIYDAAPPGELPATYVVLGPEEVRDRSDVSTNGAAHDFVVSVVTTSAGFHAAKKVAEAITDSLNSAPLVLSRGRLVSLNFLRAKADRAGRGSQRRIDMRFRALVEDT